jgi:DNA-binding Lrp family transcriptional regulator
VFVRLRLSLAVVRAVAQRLVHDIAEVKFGKESARIIELLHRNKYLEQQSLADRVLLPAKGGRERLYELFKHQWVEYVEISKRADYAPTSTHYLWTVNETKLRAALLESLYLSLYNLRLRRQHEFQRGKDVLDFSQNISDVKEAERFNHVTEILERLDNAVIKIVDNITVLGVL